jgi:hypothetical protein
MVFGMDAMIATTELFAEEHLINTDTLAYDGYGDSPLYLYSHAKAEFE